MGHAGRLLGIAFQIRDDMLGIWGAECRTGKEPAADIRRHKKSLPIVFALAGEDHEAAAIVKRALQQSELSGADVSIVLRVLDSIGAQRYCSALGDERKREALEVLEALPLVEERAAELRETAEFLLARDF
jgi:geranylgeranyl diphosphate synthase type I